MFSEIPSPEEFQDKVVLKQASGSANQSIPDVTVVTVCFNPLKDGRKELFRKNLDSVQEQVGVTVEHLIIDGASTDGTLDFLASYNNHNQDIRILSQSDSGIYDAMNRGIALSRGQYITFLNSDDYYHKNDGLVLSVKALQEMRLVDNLPKIAQTAHADHHADGNLLLHQFIEVAHRLVHPAAVSHTVKANVHPFSKILHDASGLDAEHRQGDAAHPQKRRIQEINSRTYSESHRLTNLISIVFQHVQKSAGLAMLPSWIRKILYHRSF